VAPKPSTAAVAIAQKAAIQTVFFTGWRSFGSGRRRRPLPLDRAFAAPA
jgi:hypothetical protein